MPKKILFVANTDLHINLCYLPYLKYLKSQGHIVHVATNTDILFDNCDRKIKLSITRTPFNFSNIFAIKELRKVIKEEKYDFISTSTPMGSVVARMAAKRDKNIKIMYTAHGFHFYKGCPLFNKIFYYPIEKILMKNVNILVTINEEDYRFALKHFKNDIRYIKGIGFDNKKFMNNLTESKKIVLRKKLGIKKNDYVIIYVAELSKRKRQDYLIKSLAKTNLENCKVLLVGNNNLKRNLNQMIKKCKLEDIVKILGFRNDISDLLDISNLVISVSKQEGLPLNIMEAMKKEKPIIVTDCRGNRDLIQNNINGIVIPLNDEESLRNQINYLKNNPKIARKLGSYNKKLVDDYSIETILPQYAKIYNELLEKV